MAGDLLSARGAFGPRQSDSDLGLTGNVGLALRIGGRKPE